MKEQKIKREILNQKAIENEKLEKLNLDAQGYRLVIEMRVYLHAFEKKTIKINGIDTYEFKNYIKWAYGQTDILDPLCRIDELKVN